MMNRKVRLYVPATDPQTGNPKNNLHQQDGLRSKRGSHHHLARRSTLPREGATGVIIKGVMDNQYEPWRLVRYLYSVNYYADAFAL